MAFVLAGGLSKSDWCRLELYGWPWHSALVSEHCIGRGMDCWGSEIWTIAVLLMRKTSTTFLDWFAFPGRTGKHVLDIVVLRKTAFLSLIFSPCQDLKSNLEAYIFQVQYLTTKVCLLGTHEEFEDEIKKVGSDQDGCFISFEVAMGNYQLAYC